jgi:hypothetical protein
VNPALHHPTEISGRVCPVLRGHVMEAMEVSLCNAKYASYITSIVPMSARGRIQILVRNIHNNVEYAGYGRCWWSQPWASNSSTPEADGYRSSSLRTLRRSWVILQLLQHVLAPSVKADNLGGTGQGTSLGL